MLAPAPVLTVMVERHPQGEPEIHLHAGGQGFWVARMIRLLGVRVSLCAPLGGETGTVLRALLEAQGLDARIVATAASNAAYVQERRERGRGTVAETSSPALSRHEADELYGSMLTAGIASDISVLTGTRDEGVIDPDFYRRVTADLRANGRLVAADLSRASLAAALSGGLDILHIDARELCEHMGTELVDPSDFVLACRQLRDEGAANVIVSRGSKPVIALLGGRALELRGPRFEARDPHGTGDTMFATLVAGIAEGVDLETALRRGVAGGALNVARRGLGTGSPQDIQRLAESIRVQPLARSR